MNSSHITLVFFFEKRLFITTHKTINYFVSHMFIRKKHCSSHINCIFFICDMELFFKSYHIHLDEVYITLTLTLKIVPYHIYNDYDLYVIQEQYFLFQINICDTTLFLVLYVIRL